MNFTSILAGRREESAELARVLSSKRPGLVLLRGQPGVGKTELLLSVLSGLRHVYFRAAPLTGSDNRALMWREIVRTTGVRSSEEAPEWARQLGMLQELSERDWPGLTLVIDDFPLLCEAERELPRLIRRSMESMSKRSSPLHLVLCGSDERVMRELTGRRGPLGDIDAVELEVAPLPYREACTFFRGWSAADALRGYAVFGGVPRQLCVVDPQRSLEDTVRRNVLAEGGALREQPLRLLRSELRSVYRYSSVLRAIAKGAELYSEILEEIPEFATPADLGPYLRKLVELGWVRRSLPFGRSPGRARNARYAVEDPFLGFWFGAVLPARSRLVESTAAEVYRDEVAPRLERHSERVFGRVCRAYVRRHATEGLGAAAREVGEWWGADARIPVIGTLRDGAAVYGACDWAGDASAAAGLARLREAAHESGHARGARVRHLLWFSPTRPPDAALQAAEPAERIQWIGHPTLLDWPDDATADES